jgi:hypothetical protein
MRIVTIGRIWYRACNVQHRISSSSSLPSSWSNSRMIGRNAEEAGTGGSADASTNVTASPVPNGPS